MSERTLRVGPVVIVCFLLATRVGAQAWGYGPGVLANPLGLSDDQTRQIQEILTRWEEELQPLWSSLYRKNLELEELMWSSSPDPAAVEAKSKECGNLRVEIQRMSLEKRNAIRDVLNDDQRALYDRSALGYGGGGGPCGLGLARGWLGGRGRGRGGAGAGWTPGLGRGMGMTGWGWPGSGWGRGPCGMGLGRAPMTPWMGRWRW